MKHSVQVSASPLWDLRRAGQSPWIDSFRRGWILSGELQRLVRDDGITGVTVNPSIFEHAIAGSTDYDGDIRRLAAEGRSTEEVYEDLMVHDIRMAADIFRPVYDETDGTDGFVSIELPPSLAYDTVGSIREAHRFRSLIDRENIMIKVPGTPQGVPAVEELTYDGINVNITLLFSIDSYEAVAHAYIRGMQRRLADGEPLNNVASVASFFVSRIDSAVDKQIDQMIGKTDDSSRRSELESLKGKAAIANAKLAYQRFEAIFRSPRFKELEDSGARAQKVLWASTGTKNPKYSDTYYIDTLIGPQTVNTMPPQTISAFKDHGVVRPTLEENLDEARDIMRGIKDAGIDFDDVTKQLQDDGVKLFQKSVDEMMACLSAKVNAVNQMPRGRQTLHLRDYEARVDQTLRQLGNLGFTRRLWEKDASLWKQPADGEKAIKNRLGWLDVVDMVSDQADELMEFVDDIRDAGFTHAVLLGMGGSSLSPEVSRLTFGVKAGYPDLTVLDTTVPSAILDTERRIDLPNTLFIVSSKSGTTVETVSGCKYFYEKLHAIKGDEAGKNFIVITDIRTPLDEMVHELGFRAVFTNPSDIGGRYSALSYFGLIPAAIIGVDIGDLLHKASSMIESCASCVAPRDNTGVILGTVLGELALAGRDKVTILASPEIEGFGLWVEQLLAESTGKNGTGLIPVMGEIPGSAESYGDDRLFVFLRLETLDNRELDEKVNALGRAGHPVVQIRLDGAYDIGQEYFRWEVATATAGALLGVNPFDEPNVRESKDNTGRLLDEFKNSGKLPDEQMAREEDGIKLFCDAETKSALDKIRAASPYVDDSLVSYISAHLSRHMPGDYLALMAFLRQSDATDGIFDCMRGQLRDTYQAAATFGYGPRFLHSTGQLHKGGPNSGVFIQFTADDTEDAQIPGEPYSYSTLKQAQAMGDAISLRSKGRPLIRLHVGPNVPDGLNRVLELVHEAAGHGR